MKVKSTTLFSNVFNQMLPSSRGFWIAMLWGFGFISHPLLHARTDSIPHMEIETVARQLMKKGDIPGMSIAIIAGENQVIKTYGYRDVKKKQLVDEKTLFQIGSCSKAFTALAVTLLEQQNKLSLSDKVSDYLPWFRVHYVDKKTYKRHDTTITLGQLLHHTSGIPWSTISLIPETAAENATEITVRKLIGIELEELPGKVYEYATINYDVLALVIQVIVQKPFEAFLKDEVFEKLQLTQTDIGQAKDSSFMSKGYKIGFFRPLAYKAPLYKGNNAAGYVISSIEDIGKWVEFQMGKVPSDLYPFAQLTHQRDRTVPLHNMAAYARGWEVNLDGSGEIFHGGYNPNFTTFIAFRPEKQLGVAVLANSNSTFTPIIGRRIMKILAGEELVNEYDPGDRGDKSFSIISFALLLYLIGAIGFISWKIHAIAIRKAVFTGWKKLNLLTYLKGLILISPFLMGIYWFPNALAGFDWESILVWMPISFQAMIFALLTAIGISYLAFLINLLFKVEQSYKAKAPFVLLMSIISGLANVIVIILVTSAIDSEIELKYLVFYYALVVGLYLLGRRYVQISLIKIARGIVYDLRLQLTDKIFSTSYENFERIEKGKVYTALNDDVNTLGQSASLIVNLVTSIITTIGAFIFLSLIAFWAAIIVVLLIVALASVYYGVVHSTNTYFEEARDERNRYMRLIGGMIEGFKELIIRRSKKLAFKVDIDKSAEVLKDRMSTADIRFVKAFIVGESLLIVLLGFIAIGMPRMFDNIQNYTVMSFVIVLLYLIGPINGILSAVPAVLQLRIAWNRIKNFVNEIPVVFNQQEVKGNFEVAHFSVERVLYTYKHSEDDKGFAVGPIDFEVRRGEIIFLIGGNGSGKTTFAKLIMGLYRPQEGEIKINGERVKYSLLGEYFSVIFSPPYLFEKLYDIDLEEKKDQLCKYLSLLELDKKVTIHNGRFSTIDLSSGQRKRLALLLCFLEDRPIYLFDEWAADQDPAYRRFFYQTLLPEMKNEGKIIIAITHDDSYFHIADRILKMEEGTLKPLNKEYDLPILE